MAVLFNTIFNNRMFTLNRTCPSQSEFSDYIWQATVHLLRDQSYQGGDSSQKGRTRSWEILKRTPKICQDPSLWVWLEIFLHP